MHIPRSLCMITTSLYMVLHIVYCFMHAYDRSLVNVNSPIPCLVSMNSSSDDLIESVYYMFIPMQHISVLRIFSSFCINTQSNYICKIPCSKTKSHKQKCKSPLTLWPLRGVTSTELKRPHFSDPPSHLAGPDTSSLASLRFWEDGDAELEVF